MLLNFVAGSSATQSSCDRAHQRIAYGGSYQRATGGATEASNGCGATLGVRRASGYSADARAGRAARQQSTSGSE